MNVYDEVNNLAKALKECLEYKEYKEIKEKVKTVPDLKEKIDEFEKIRYEEQVLAIQGEEMSKEKMKKLQQLYEILVKNPDVKKYFDMEVRFNVMMAAVNKIIGEAIKDVL